MSVHHPAVRRSDVTKTIKDEWKERLEKADVILKNIADEIDMLEGLPVDYRLGRLLSEAYKMIKGD